MKIFHHFSRELVRQTKPTRREGISLKINYPTRRGLMSKISKIKPWYQHRILKRPGSFQSHEKFLKAKMILKTKIKCKKSTNQQALKNGQKNCWKKQGRLYWIEFYFIFTMRVLLQGRPGVGGYLRPDRLAGRHEGPVDPDRGSAQLQPADWLPVQGEN